MQQNLSIVTQIKNKAVKNNLISYDNLNIQDQTNLQHQHLKKKIKTPEHSIKQKSVLIESLKTLKRIKTEPHWTKTHYINDSRMLDFHYALVVRRI